MTNMKTFEKIAYVDWRRDHSPGDVTLLGHQVNSFANARLVIDQVKKDGFTGIILNTNVPIDPETGELQLFYNINLGIPKDTWRVVQYAKKQGLTVEINFNIVDYITDNALTSGIIGKNFSTATFFKSVADYESNIAKLAEKYKVDVIGIGDHQFGFDNEEYRADWQNIVDQVRKNFKGKLSYTSSNGGDTVINELVDIIKINRGPDTFPLDQLFDHVQILQAKHNKPVQISPIFSTATNTGVDPWSMLMNNQSLNSVSIRSDLQADKIREILKASIIDQPDFLFGLGFGEYSPWLEASWIVKPSDEASRKWNLSGKLGTQFYKNQTASDTLKNWFNYSNADVVGTKKNDTLKVYAGDKMIDGGAGRDTVVISNTIKNCRITKDTINGGFDVDNGINGIDGNYDMYNVEIVKFNDATVKLVGNFDLSKYGWFV